MTRHHRTASSLKAFWDEEADFLEKDTSPQRHGASFAEGEMLRELSARQSCDKTRRKGESEGLGSVASQPLRPRPTALSEGKSCPEQLRRCRLLAYRPPRRLVLSGSPHGRGRPTAARLPAQPPALPPLTAAPRRGRLRAYLRWSKEWMLRAAFPCPPPTQLRERPNMLAASSR